MEVVTRLALLSFGAAIIWCSPPARAGVIVVDDSGGPGVTTKLISTAVSLAAPGDVILVKSGTYSRFSISGKPITITADAGAVVDVIGVPGAPTIAITGIASVERVVLRGLRVHGGRPAIDVNSNGGIAWLEDVVVDQAETGVSVVASSAVIQRCTLTGIDIGGDPTAPPFLAGYPALFVDGGARVNASHSTFAGGGGKDAICFGLPACYSTPGGAGAQVESGSLLALACNLIGGEGGAAHRDVVACQPASAGGIGLRLGSGSPIVGEFGCVLAGGAGGPGPGTCASGMPGAATQITSGNLVSIAGMPRSYSATSPVRESNASTLSFTGKGGDRVMVLIAARPFLLGTSYSGSLLTAPPVFIVDLGVLPFAGSLAMPVNTGLMSPGLFAIEVFTQAAFVDTAGRVYLANGSVVDVLDSQF